MGGWGLGEVRGGNCPLLTPLASTLLHGTWFLRYQKESPLAMKNYPLFFAEWKTTLLVLLAMFKNIRKAQKSIKDLKSICVILLWFDDFWTLVSSYRNLFRYEFLVEQIIGGQRQRNMSNGSCVCWRGQSLLLQQNDKITILFLH